MRLFREGQCHSAVGRVWIPTHPNQLLDAVLEVVQSPVQSQSFNGDGHLGVGPFHAKVVGVKEICANYALVPLNPNDYIVGYFGCHHLVECP